MTDSVGSAKQNEVPQAVVISGSGAGARRFKTRMWWLTGCCGLVALLLVIASWRAQGTPITVTFESGYGLKPGDTLRYRGIDVGSVTRAELSSDLSAVQVTILLSEGHENLAVEGSQFWIERARVRLGEVRGLETVLGANYVSVIPGDPQAPAQRRFVGLETPLGMSSGGSTTVQLEFPAGEGLEVGDRARYRGIAVGEVTQIELATSLDRVMIEVRLVGASQSLARAGTQFWIERPRVDLTEVRGLDTLLGGRYIAVEPATSSGPRQTYFVGLAEPPPLPKHDGSLEIELDAPSRMGVVRGAPISYRGLEVGRVSNVGLAEDAASVKVRAVIDAQYTELVRENTKWWAVGGLEFDASLRGVNLSMESLSSWIRGGIAFATPPSPGEQAVTGHRYMLERQPLPEWLNWQPRIAIHGMTIAGQRTALPRPLRVVASWNASLLGLYRRRTVETWGVAIDDGTLRVPKQFIQQAQQESEKVAIEVAGISFELNGSELIVDGEIVHLPAPEEMESAWHWPRAQLDARGPGDATLLIVNPELSVPMAIDSTRVSKGAGGVLQIAPGVAIAAGLSGSPAVNADTGRLFGLLVRLESDWVVVPLH